MMKYIVLLSKTTYGELLVEAENEEEAEQKAWEGEEIDSVESQNILEPKWDCQSVIPLKEHPARNGRWKSALKEE